MNGSYDILFVGLFKLTVHVAPGVWTLRGWGLLGGSVRIGALVLEWLWDRGSDRCQYCGRSTAAQGSVGPTC